MKLLIETTESFEVLTEESENGKDLYIQGVFMQSEVKNRNGRVYPKGVMEREVNRYIAESVQTKRAIGELGHPKGPQLNLDRVCHLITEMRLEGNNVMAKAKVLDTPPGRIVKNFVDGGVSFGVSSRALGSLKKDTRLNAQVVQNDFRLFAVDVVADPSAPDAYVNALMEGKEWIWENGILIEKDLDGQRRAIEEAYASKDTTKRSEAIRDAYYGLFKALSE